MMAQAVQTWPGSLHNPAPFDRASFEALLTESAVPALILPGFLDAFSCARIVTNLQSLGMGSYGHINHHVGRFGLTQMEYYLKGQKEAYFQAVADAERRYSESIAGAEANPVEKLIRLIEQKTGRSCRRATESPSLGSYFAGTYRNVNSVGRMHFDFGRLETQAWEISQVSRQLTWNLYLNEPRGGDLVVYDRRYNPADEAHREPGEYWYSEQLVRGAQKLRYSPRIGDLVIFDCVNFHEVEQVTGDRYTLSSFIGLAPSGDLIFWS